MIANITTILYIKSVSNEILSNGTLQKGIGVSRIDDDDVHGLQLYKYSNYLTSDDSDSSDDIEIIPLEEDKIYLITGKFSIS